jgi:Lysozyme like domain
MTQLTCQQVAEIWVAAGGAQTAIINAVAVSSAESGRRTDAISPSADFGLWQINSIHFGEYGITAANWSNPVANAVAAIGISGNGANWAAWCTCWTNPGPNCGHGYLPRPEAGSPAGNEIGFVVSQLGTGGGGPVNPPTNPPDVVQAAWSNAQNLVGRWSTVQYDALASATAALGRLFP